MRSSDPGPRRSIGVKLPLAIGGLLIVGVVIGAWVTFDSVRQAALRSTAERLDAVTLQLIGMLSGSAAKIHSTMRAAADTISSCWTNRCTRCN